MNLAELRKEIKSKYDSERAEHSKSFFKTGKGEYGEGDVFYGLSVPEQRKIVVNFWKDITLNECEELLQSKVHEERLVSLLILVKKFEKNTNERKDIFDLYLRNAKRVNNWDLVDSSAHKIVGKYLLDKVTTSRSMFPAEKDRAILYKLARSDNLWEKRISIISTFMFIANREFEDTLNISEVLLKDKHDLIHKAVGWALREVGKKNQEVEEVFLKKYYKQMPRTMLRYAIERFPEKLRESYLNGEI
jgi:3-methyladenine DNA glycosylase AlkD